MPVVDVRVTGKNTLSTGEMINIELDAEDLDMLSQIRAYRDKRYSGVYLSWVFQGRSISLARAIMERKLGGKTFGPRIRVIHLNHNRFNFRRDNLMLPEGTKLDEPQVASQDAPEPPKVERHYDLKESHRIMAVHYAHRVVQAEDNGASIDEISQLMSRGKQWGGNEWEDILYAHMREVTNPS